MRNRATNRLVAAGFVLSFCCCAALFTLNAGGEPEPVAMAREAFKKAFPKTTVERMAPTVIPGLYEIATGGAIIYFAPEGNHLFIGEILTPQGISITAGRREELRTKLLSDLPLEIAIKTGSGRNRVIEFTDPDCPFCRKAAAFFRQRNDVTRYVFFAPLVQLHPDAERKATWVLGARDREAAYQEVMDGLRDRERLPQPDSRANELP